MSSTAPPLSDLFRSFLRIGLLSFGGPAAQISVMHRELVEDRGWLNEQQFLRALSLCMLLPGPEAMQLSTYCGWRLRGVPGGLIAGLLFVLPGAAVIAVLAVLYAELGSVPLVQSLFVGVKAAVIVIVLQALAKLSRKTLQSSDRWIIAVLALVGIAVLDLPFPLIILGAALYGAFLGRRQGADPSDAQNARLPMRSILIWLLIWWGPVAGLALLDAHFLTNVALFFSKLAIVTFGGAYAVLAYMAQEVVSDYGWISAPQMLDALGLAETTPGPLILVTQFVAMLAGHIQGGVTLALAAGVVALWVTFVPCFLWIFTFAPYVDWLGQQPRLAAALSAITAAVVGVIANLSIWFAAHVYFSDIHEISFMGASYALPDPTSFAPLPAGLSVIAALLLWRFKLSLPLTLMIAAGLGAGWGMLSGSV
ncbi:chromate efflux transporter [Qingshengfaniella alkalisoli]|uniref:Chromate efflux transporter n=1 Tax=Qingshengfaniella alkalisoli TaxID=2599296 RepID=A0A5B8IU68_9RHOB|nr:chromate efflux transporter [Qingshengfaniella alkalisoli]QDY69174.1 chromate efflux transporter [Qingshengfaniella alkalisoli]